VSMTYRKGENTPWWEQPTYVWIIT
jgi:hypothetical protein